jgi:hypothetical protein
MSRQEAIMSVLEHLQFIALLAPTVIVVLLAVVSLA